MNKKAFETVALTGQSLASGAAIAAALASLAGMTSIPPVVPLLGAVIALALTVGALTTARLKEAGQGGN